MHDFMLSADLMARDPDAHTIIELVEYTSPA
jgi:hypothetical protein